MSNGKDKTQRRGHGGHRGTQIQNAKCKMQKCKMQNAKCKMQNAKCKMQRRA
jgi:hypothetical protein